MADRTPSRVRAFLREELPRWHAEGILDEQGAETLARRYLAESETTGVAVAALYLLAACMVGAGIISLVAWHWDELARGVRLAILGAALVAAHGVGFWMWQVRGRHPLLGHAISLLGTLIFGASIGLVAQIFHVSGPWYGAFGAWGLGALVAGLVLPSLPALALAMVLGLFVWGPWYVADHAAVGDAVAWLLGGVSLALAFRSRSRVLFLLATSGLAAVVGTASVVVTKRAELTHLFALLLGITAAACGLAGLRLRGAPHPFAGVAALLGRIGLCVVAYWLSFEGGAGEVVSPLVTGSRGWVTCALPPLLVATTLLFATRRPASEERARRATAVIATAFAALFVVLALVEVDEVVLAFAANAGLLAVAGVQIASGLQAGRRAPFWEGLGVAAVVACSRFFEIDELLWLKGLGFIACGLAVTVAALVFEKRVRGKRTEVHHA